MPLPHVLDAPVWVRESGNDPRFPRDRYLVGFGLSDDISAKGLDDARLAATTEISSQIEVQIKSQIEQITREIRQNQDINLKTDFTQISSADTAALFRGTTSADSYQDPSKGTWYALVVVPREQVADEFLKEGESQLAQVRAEHDQSEQAERSHSPTVAIQSAIKAYTGLLQIEKDACRALAILPNNAGVKQRVDNLAVPELKTEVVKQLGELMSRVQLEVVGGDRQQGSPGAALPEPLTFQAQYLESSTPIALSYFPWRATVDGNATRAVLLRDSTDGDGKAGFRLQELHLTGKNANLATAALDYGASAGPVAEEFPRRVTFTYFLPTFATTRVLVAIDERIDDKPSTSNIADDKVSTFLTGLGIAVVKNDGSLRAPDLATSPVETIKRLVGDRADYVIYGTVDCRFSSKPRTQTFYKTRASLNALELLTGRVLHVDVSPEDTKIAKLDPAQAAAASIEMAFGEGRILTALEQAFQQRLAEGKEFGAEH
jgi:hypothetical protein